MVVNQYVGDIITCNGKTMTITGNTATVFTGASWSGGGNPGDHYAWSLNTGTKYYKSATHPAVTMGDTDFIIAVNISGIHDLAWNAIANQVIGSAWIQNAAIKTALIEDLAVTTALIADAAINTAKITDLNVTTIKIGNNAVTIPVSAYTAGQIAMTVDVETTIQSLSITTSGAQILTVWSFTFQNAYAGWNSTIYCLKRSMSGTTNGAVTTTNTKLTDTRLAMSTNEYVGATVTCNGKTLQVSSNDATSFTGSAWSGGGNPGNGYAWSVVKTLHEFGGCVPDGNGGYEHVARNISEQPSAGTHTYYLTAICLSGAGAAEWRSLSVLETKK